jgi:hypothetical protein
MTSPAAIPAALEIFNVVLLDEFGIRDITVFAVDHDDAADQATEYGGTTATTRRISDGDELNH